jgi:hypothetical protein
MSREAFVKEDVAELSIWASTLLVTSLGAFQKGGHLALWDIKYAGHSGRVTNSLLSR